MMDINLAEGLIERISSMLDDIESKTEVRYWVKKS